MRMGRAVGISAATMASRLLGLVREQIFAAVIGANRFSDAYVVAFRIPNLLRDLFAEGALSAALVPTFADYDRNRGRRAAYALANGLVAVVLLGVGCMTLAGMALARPLVRALAPGFGAEQTDLAASLARLMMPFLLLVSLSAVAMGLLNAQARFFAPALAPALFNVGAIAVGVGLWVADCEPATAVVGWSLGTLVGGVLQLAVQAPALRRAGFRPSLRLTRSLFAEPGLRRIGKLLAAAVVGLSATQINIVVNTIFASRAEAANTWLQYAFRLMQLPLGVFGVAIATVAGAGVAQRAAAGDRAGLQATLVRAMRLVALLNVPAAVGLMVLAGPIVSVLYEHGRFTGADTAGTAAALVYYAIGLYGYSAVKIFAQAFYTVGVARVPVAGSLVGVAVNLLFNVTLFPVLGYRGVALGTSLAATANFAVLVFAWRRRFGLAAREILSQLGRVLAASAVTVLVARAAVAGLAPYLPAAGLGRQLPLALVV